MPQQLMPTVDAETREYAFTDEDFVYVWTLSRTAREVAARLSKPGFADEEVAVGDVVRTAAEMRAAGVRLDHKPDEAD